MRLLAIVEVGVDGVLEQMHDAIAGHDEDRAQRRTQAEALRGHLQQGGGHKKAGAERNEVAQVALDAVGAHQHQAAGYVGQRGTKPRRIESLSMRRLPAVPDVHHVAIVHNVLLAFEAQGALGACCGF